MCNNLLMLEWCHIIVYIHETLRADTLTFRIADLDGCCTIQAFEKFNILLSGLLKGLHILTTAGLAK